MHYRAFSMHVAKYNVHPVNYSAGLIVTPSVGIYKRFVGKRESLQARDPLVFPNQIHGSGHHGEGE